MKKNITIDRTANTIEITKAFYNKACQFGTPEFEELNKAVQMFPNYTITYRNTHKKTYSGLTIQKMEAYITVKDPKMLEKFNAVKKVAEARKALYPLTKQWFLETYKNITMKEIEEAVKTKNQADLDTEAVAELDALSAKMTNQDLEEEEPESNVVNF